MTTNEKMVNIIKSSFYQKLAILALFMLVIFILFIYVINQLDLNRKNCENINKNDYKTSVVSINDINHNLNLRDYYIKAAYNCCCGGNFKNDFVNLCALENCIKQGARFLDFEIYSINKEPVVAASSLNTRTYKETYNHINFNKAMEMVSTYAFSSSFCPNPDDPLILFFRINTNNKSIYNKIAYIINRQFRSSSYDYLLSSNYGYNNNENNIGEIPLKNAKKKTIIFVYQETDNNLLTDSKLFELTNAIVTPSTSNSHVKLYREDEVLYANENNDLVQFNKSKMSIVLPNLNNETNNINYIKSYDAGCQIVAMSFQNFDAELQFNNIKFDEENSAFILKPQDLRLKKIIIDQIDPLIQNSWVDNCTPGDHTINFGGTPYNFKV